MPSPPVTADCARTALFLDVDGTLLEIRDRPEDVVADAGLVDLLDDWTGVAEAIAAAASRIESRRDAPMRARALTNLAQVIAWSQSASDVPGVMNPGLASGSSPPSKLSSTSASSLTATQASSSRCSSSALST